jgi:DNA-binding NtrC family response regulator
MVPVAGSLSSPSHALLDTALEDLYRRSLASDGAEALKLRDWVQRAEAWRIVQALRECRGNRSAAARSLGIGRRTLYSKMEKLGLGPAWSLSPTPARSN